MNIKRSILVRIRIAFFLMVLFSIAIIVKMNVIQHVQGEKWRAKANSITYQFRPIKATRGNIYSDNGSLLATSLPFYKVAFDPTIPSDKTFNENLDSLSIKLSEFFRDKSAIEYRRLLQDARAEGRQYLPISRKMLNYHDKKELEKWPIFELGRYNGGVIFEKVDKRFLPFDELSERTIGFINENNRGAGLEYSFNSLLAGRDGEAMYQKISGGNWKPLFDSNEIKSKDGSHIMTTIDINLQDVSETALRRALVDHSADYGVVVVMEVKTGEIKAISNLTRKGDQYLETYNHAVGGLYEPGSTMKLATLLALLEDTNISLKDSIDTGDGEYKIYNNRVRDHHEGGWGKLTIQESFEKSSNVAMVKLVEKYYGLNPEKYVDWIDKLGLSRKLDFQIKGEGVPKIQRPGQSGWSGISLPWMAHGYGLEVTPLHILTLFNAVANDGKMIQPKIVSALGETESDLKPAGTKVMNDRICSKETLAKLRLMLEGVVENGTAENIKGTHYKIAGKTGTTQILENGRYTSRYITSFAGYFPAHEPKYSAVVVVKNPKGWRQYGSNVSAPVFKEIADNIYSRDLEMHEEFTTELSERVSGVFPLIRSGWATEISLICNEIGVSNHLKTEGKWAKTRVSGNAIELVSNDIKMNQVPDVVGMTLRDALYVLESAGLRVSHQGSGRVEKQSLIAGGTFSKGNHINIVLN